MFYVKTLFTHPHVIPIIYWNTHTKKKNTILNVKMFFFFVHTKKVNKIQFQLDQKVLHNIYSFVLHGINEVMQVLERHEAE